MRSKGAVAAVFVFAMRWQAIAWLVPDAAFRHRSKETLYMFFTPTGNFIAANCTGQ